MWKLNQEPWQKWLQVKVLFDGEGGGEGGGGGGGGEGAPTGGGGGEPSVPAGGGEPTAPGTPGAPTGASTTTQQPQINDAALWREQAEHSMRELQKTTAALQQVLGQQRSSPTSPTSTIPGGKVEDLFNIDPKELAGLHPAVQAMFRAMKEQHEMLGGMKSQFDHTATETAAATEARQLKETESALNNHIDTTLEAAGLPKGGTLTSMVGRVALQSLKTLHGQGYLISRNVIDSVVNDLVTSIKQDMTPKQPTALPPQPKPGGGGNPQLSAVPTAADRKAALTAAISSMNMED